MLLHGVRFKGVFEGIVGTYNYRYIGIGCGTTTVNTAAALGHQHSSPLPSPYFNKFSNHLNYIHFSCNFSICPFFFIVQILLHTVFVGPIFPFFFDRYFLKTYFLSLIYCWYFLLINFIPSVLITYQNVSYFIKLNAILTQVL